MIHFCSKKEYNIIKEILYTKDKFSLNRDVCQNVFGAKRLLDVTMSINIDILTASYFFELIKRLHHSNCRFHFSDTWFLLFNNLSVCKLEERGRMTSHDRRSHYSSTSLNRYITIDIIC